MKRIVITCGDINGIGPEIIAKALNKITIKKNIKYYLLIPENIFADAFQLTQSNFIYEIVKNYEAADHKNIKIVSVISHGKVKYNPGKATKVSGDTAFKTIKYSYDLANKKYVDGIVTAPISKGALTLTGIDTPGHTEMYASWCGVKDFVMMFISKKMKAAILTIHLPLKKVPGNITEEKILHTIRTVSLTLENDFRIENPKIALLGLNPHAGEKGRIGNEEIEIIYPAIKKLIKNKYIIEGPFPPDGFYANRTYSNYDVVIGMYHDQVLIPFKLLNFGGGVNYTAGLPIIRTSPDHGTAFNIAWKGIADERSIIEAIYLASKIISNRRK